jgi:hypothetical protein
MKTQIKFVFASLLTLAIFAGCKSLMYADRENPDLRLAEGNYEEAQEIIRSRENEYINEKNLISYHLDMGLLRHFAGDYLASTKELEEAKRLIQEAWTVSISERVKSIVSNNVKNDLYRGGRL